MYDFSEQEYYAMEHWVTMGAISVDQWKDYCFQYLERLMIHEREVLMHLKNI